jgi:serine/threonine-protein kinase
MDIGISPQPACERHVADVLKVRSNADKKPSSSSQYRDNIRILRMSAADTAPVAADRQRLPSLSFGPFAFDTRTRLLSRDGQEIPLPPRVLSVLELMLSRAGDVVARQELIDAVWKDAFVTDTSLAEAISVLRQALGDDPQAPTYIQTLHRRGYRFVAPVATSAPPVETRSPAVRADTSEVVSPSIGGQLVPWSAAAICALIAAIAIWQLSRTEGASRPPAARFTAAAAAGTAFDQSAPAMAISADGSQLAWSGCDSSGCRLYLRPLYRLDALPVAGSEDGRAPFFSPDGRWLGFFADGRLKKVAVGGGTPTTLADAPSVLGGTWLDREIVFAGSPTGGLMRISAEGGEPKVLTTPRETDGEVRHAWPAAVPGSQVLLFTIETSAEERAPGILGALSLDAWGASEATRWSTLASGVTLSRAPASDTIVMARGTELDAVAFDPARIATAGAPRTVLTGVAGARGLASYALSATGSLAVLSAPQSSRAITLAWMSGPIVTIPSEEVSRLQAARLSSDGAKVAGVNVEGGRTDIWVADASRGSSTRLTHTGLNVSPVWAPDGRTIYFASRSTGPFELWTRDVDASQPATRVSADSGTGLHAFPLAVSPDGKLLAYSRTSPGHHADIWLLPPDGGTPRAVVTSPFDDLAAVFSPDSAMMAYQSAEAGRWEVYVVRLRDGRRAVVSTDGGQRPRWTSAGLFFESRGQIVRTSIDGSAADLRVAPLVRAAGLNGATLRGVSPDGRLLVEWPGEPPTFATVSLDWIREVRALIGPPAATLPR